MKCIFTLLTFCFFFINSARATAAEFISLGTLPGADNSWARSVSDDGLVVTGFVHQMNPPEIPQQIYRWTESTGMVGLDFLPGYDISEQSAGQLVSGDGSTIIGSNRGDNIPIKGFIHNETDGIRPLENTTFPKAVSFDGSVVVGYSNPIGAFRWTEATGTLFLGNLPGESNSGASSVSADGSVIIGYSGEETFIWTQGTGMRGLGFSGGTVVSAEGTVIGGQAKLSSVSNSEAFRWTEENGAIGLGWLPGTANDDGSNLSTVRGINGDGSLIVGFSGLSDRRRGFLWSEQLGMLDLKQLLVDQYDLGSSLEGWNLWAPQDISANGQFIAGIGINPDGVHEGWLVRLDAPVPEPGSLALVVLGGLPLLVHRRVVGR